MGVEMIPEPEIGRKAWKSNNRFAAGDCGDTLSLHE